MGVAKENVERFFKLTKRHPQLSDHASHGLFIADASIKIFHPRFKRPGGTSIFYRLKALSQMFCTSCKLAVAGIKVVECCFKIQHRRCHFHGQLNGGQLTRTRSGVNRSRQGEGQWLAWRMKLNERISDQAELVRHRLEFADIACGQC